MCVWPALLTDFSVLYGKQQMLAAVIILSVRSTLKLSNSKYTVVLHCNQLTTVSHCVIRSVGSLMSCRVISCGNLYVKTYRTAWLQIILSYRAAHDYRAVCKCRVVTPGDEMRLYAVYRRPTLFGNFVFIFIFSNACIICVTSELLALERCARRMSNGRCFDWTPSGQSQSASVHVKQ